MKGVWGVILLCLWPPQALTATKPGFLWYHPPTEQHLPPANHTTSLKALRDATTRALNQAVLTGKAADVLRYVRWQRFWQARAAVFAHTYAWVLLQHPEFDSTSRHPVSAIGAHLNQRLDAKAGKREIDALGKRFGLWFFYQGRDAASRLQVPMLKQFSDTHALAVMAISVDGVIDPRLPASRIDTGQRRKLHLSTMPAMVLVDPKGGRVMGVAHGLTTQDQLTEQLWRVAKQLARERDGERVLYEKD